MFSSTSYLKLVEDDEHHENKTWPYECACALSVHVRWLGGSALQCVVAGFTSARHYEWSSLVSGNVIQLGTLIRKA